MQAVILTARLQSFGQLNVAEDAGVFVSRNTFELARGIRTGIQQNLDHVTGAHAASGLVKRRDNPRLFAAYLFVIEFIGQSTGVEQHLHSRHIVEVHGPEHRIGAARVCTRVQQHFQTFVVAQFCGVIERFAIVRVGAMIQQPLAEHHVVGVADRAVER